MARTAYAVQSGAAAAQWLQADGTWGAALTWIDTPPTPGGAPAVTFSAAFTPPASGQYGITVQAWDFAGKLDATRPSVQITAIPPDTVPPDGTITTPTPNQQLPLAPTIILAGNATDDWAVATVDVAIRNTATGLWLRLDGTWGAFQWLPASVTSPGATSTGWTYPWAPPGTGSFAIQARATDAAGNVDPTRPSVQFKVV